MIVIISRLSHLYVSVYATNYNVLYYSNLKVLDILFRQSGFIAHHELKTGVQFFAVGLRYMSVCIFLDVCAV